MHRYFDRNTCELCTINSIVMTTITQHPPLIQPLSYTQYRQHVTELAAEGKVTGHQQSESLLNYTNLNIKRMDRWDKTIVLQDEVTAAIEKQQQTTLWVVLSQGWCGDCAQIVPVFGKIAAISNGKINLQIINSDDNPEWLDRHSVNGIRSVPKLIVINPANGETLAVWGARPQGAQNILKKWKSTPDMTRDQFELELHTWYAKDKTHQIQQELAALPIWI